MHRHLLLSTIAALGLSSSACGFLFGQSQGDSPPKESGPWTGPITFTNASSSKVCGVQFRGDHAPIQVDIAPGASVELPPHPKPESAVGLWALNCGGDGVVSGTLTMVKPDFENNRLAHGRIALYDAGATPNKGEHAIFAAPERFEDAYRKISSHTHKQWSPGTMANLTTEALGALRAYAELKRYTETYASLELIFGDWEVNRNRSTGATLYRWVGGLAMARFPSGKCTLYPVSFKQDAEGSGFAAKLVSTGAGAGMGVPCAMAAWQKSRAGVAH